MNVLLKYILLMFAALILNGCSSAYRQPYRYTPAYTPVYNNSTFNSTPTYNNTPVYKATNKSPNKPSYQTQYLAQAVASNTPKYQAAPLKVAMMSPALTPASSPIPSFDDLIRFEYDCTRKLEQIDYLQEVLRKKTFYRVDGVEGNEYSDRINKRYYALTRYRIWSLRLGCKGSNVERMTEVSLKVRSPSAAPESVPRCYFEESVVARTDLNKAEGASEEVVSKRKEFCTNYPLMADKKVVYIGDVVDPERQLDKNISYIPNLRKWNGNIFQMVSKTEMHLREVVKFTVVLMWNGASWVVVDKF